MPGRTGDVTGAATPHRTDMAAATNGTHAGVTNGHGSLRPRLFHMSEPLGDRHAPLEPLEEDHPFFSGSRDIQNPDTLLERKIVSSKGTVRGYKNRVRAGIATFREQENNIKNYRALEKGKIIVYTTTMQIVRETYENCQKVRQILQTHMVLYEDRDIFMSRENQLELRERLGQERLAVPQVFADGQHIGDADVLCELNESGELRQILKHFTRVSQMSSCQTCGGYRYVPCRACRGSKKSFHRNHFTAEFCSLRCIVCDENGLVRCEVCNSAVKL